MTRRRRVQKSGLQTHEFPASFGARRFPKGNEGKRVSSGYNRRRRLATRSSGKQQAERTAVRTAPIVCPEESPLVRPWAYTSRCWGLTRRLRRGRWGCRPEGAVLSFEAKESTKESTRHGDYGKKPFIAHFGGGARYVARSRVGQLTHAIVRARSSPFSAVKMGGPFSLRCLSPLFSAAAGAGQTQMAALGMFRRYIADFARQKVKGISKPC